MGVSTEALPKIAAARTYEDAPTATDLYNLASDWVAQHRAHKARISLYDAIVDGRWNTVWPDGTATQDMPKIAEYISSDTEGMAGLIASPESTIIVPQSSDNPKDLKDSEKRQQILYTYRRLNRLKRLLRKTAIDLISTGLACWVVWPDFNSYMPRYGRKDPRIVYPDPALDDPTEVDSLIVRYVTKTRLLIKSYPWIVPELFTSHEIREELHLSNTEQLEIVEYYDADCCVKIVNRAARDARYKNRSIRLSYVPNFTSGPLAFIAYRDSADGRFRGQFDKAIAPLGTANKLMELHLAQQADMIFAEKIVRGAFDNPEDVGPGATLYTMDYQSNIERAEVAQSSQQLYQDVNLLLDQSRTAAGIPQGWHGAVDQNIISAQGITALNAPLLTAVESYQEHIADLEMRANERALEVDENYLDAKDKMLSGVAGGRAFDGTYTPSIDIAGRTQNRVVYPAGSAMDSYNKSVLAINQVQNGLLSRRGAMEFSATVEDVASMEAEIFKERLIDGFVAGLSDPAVDLATRAEAIELTFKGKTPEEVAIELKKRMEEQAAAAAVESQSAAELVPGAAPAAAGAIEEGPALPPLPGGNY